MDFSALLDRAIESPEPAFRGSWSVISFRPDLGSQQEFVVGVAALAENGSVARAHWVPSVHKLAKLYGESMSASDTLALFQGAERSLRSASRIERQSDLGSPHLRLVPCGFFAANDVDIELLELLKRHAAAIWWEPTHKESPMDDDWAYATMAATLRSMRGIPEVLVTQRFVTIHGRRYELALNNGRSYGDILSARYAKYHTVESHVFRSVRQVWAANRADSRPDSPALFVVLPEAGSSVEAVELKRSQALLQEVEDMGVSSFSSEHPKELAEQIVDWATR